LFSTVWGIKIFKVSCKGSHVCRSAGVNSCRAPSDGQVLLQEGVTPGGRASDGDVGGLIVYLWRHDVKRTVIVVWMSSRYVTPSV